MIAGKTSGNSSLNRPGFTLIELLIVIAIVGVMVGLLLPAVQSTRESARAVSCRNNLLNMHLAVESYYVAFDAYPAGTVTDRLPARMFADGKDHGWLVQIRPFLDGGFEFTERWSTADSAYHPRNWALTQMGPGFFECPSSPAMHRSGVTPLSYVGIHDGVDSPIDTTSGGMFVANRFLRRSEIPDGLSSTLQLGEIAVHLRDTFFWTAGNQSTLRTTGLPFSSPTSRSRGDYFDEQRTQIAYGRFADPPRISYEDVEAELRNDLSDTMDNPIAVEEALMRIAARLESEAEADTDTDFDSDALVTFDSGFQKLPGYTLPKVGSGSAQPMTLGSSHHTMVNAAFADGRVVTLSMSIDAKLYSQIGVRNDHGPLELPLVQFP